MPVIALQPSSVSTLIAENIGLAALAYLYNKFLIFKLLMRSHPLSFFDI